MAFTSFNFLIFFPLVLILYWLTPGKYRYITLLIASYFFYINVKPVLALVLFGVSAAAWGFALLMSGTRNEKKRRTYFLVNIIIVLLPLVFFKYFSAINNALLKYLTEIGLNWPLPEMRFILPIGISFYTFMALGYAIDVYNDELKAEKNPGIIGLFISFFPLILSGPIERAGNMLPQFRKAQSPDFALIAKGLQLILWGYFMKLVVADRIGIYVTSVYSHVEHHNGTSLLFASMLYPFQLYADLGGYSLIAIGCSNILGYKIIPNFNRPFFAPTMAEFWRRWHMSLITWLTDYVYTPLSFALRKYKVWGIVCALLLTFLLSGIWHGATMTFLMWGLMQGIFLSAEALLNQRKTLIEKKYSLEKKRWYIAAGIVFTFLMFSSSMVFSRAATFHDAMVVYNKIFTEHGPLFVGSPSTMIYLGCGLILLLLKDFLDEFYPHKIKLFDNDNTIVRTMSYSAIIIIILLIGVFDSSQFIYFQF